jgi:cytochrome c-type biogenesis protein CcmE
MHLSVKKRIYFSIFITTIIIFVGAILIWQLRSNMVFFYNTTDVILLSQNNKNIWLGGLIKSYNTKEKDNYLLHVFVITDNKTDITVEYNGILPSLFKIGQGAVIYGKLNNKIMQANRVAIKHDEVYMTPEKYAKLRQKI